MLFWSRALNLIAIKTLIDNLTNQNHRFIRSWFSFTVSMLAIASRKTYKKKRVLMESLNF